MPLYTFELTFTGLCVFTYEGTNKKHPRRFNVIIPDLSVPLQESRHHEAKTHHGDSNGDCPDSKDSENTAHQHPTHFPQLCCWARDVSNEIPAGFRLEPTPSGKQMVLGEIAQQRISLKIPQSSKTKLKLLWRPKGKKANSFPCDKKEEKWLDWIAPLLATYTHLEPASNANPYEGLDEISATTRVILEHGRIFASDFPRDPDDDSHVLWRFVDEDGTTSDPPVIQALAGSLVLQIKVQDTANESTSIDIRSSAGWTLEIKPPSRYTKLTQASITNLPHVVPRGYDIKKLSHFELLKRIAGWTSYQAKPRLPELKNPEQTSGPSFCPPPFYNEASNVD